MDGYLSIYLFIYIAWQSGSAYRAEPQKTFIVPSFHLCSPSVFFIDFNFVFDIEF